MSTTIKIRRGTKGALDSIVLSEGEIGFTTDTEEVFIGDGTNHYLVGKVMVDTFNNRPNAGVSGRMYYASDSDDVYIDDGSAWIDISATVDESEIDHDQLLNYDPNEHIDHTTVNINTNAPLTGGGDISTNRTLDISLDATDLGVDGSNQLYVKDTGIDHNATTNVHQDVTTTATPSFNGVTITGSITEGTDATSKDYVDGLIQGLDWQESVLDRYDPSGGLPGTPTTGDRYISTATANEWTENYIYEYDGASWIETIPDEGTAVWVEDEDVQYVFNTISWIKLASIYQHNNLSGLQGGAVGEYYHLDATEFGYLDGQDQSVSTTDSPTFNDLTITDPFNIYNSLALSGFSDYDPSEFIDWTLDQGATNIHEGNITELSVTQHEAAINHDNLTGFVANEHINHSDVSINTGNGLTGGGDLTTSRTLSINNDTTTGATVAPFNISSNGVGVLIDNSSITHSAGELTVSLVDGGAF